MTRQQALSVIWRKLLLIFVLLLGISIPLSLLGGPFTVPLLTFIAGNVGGYVGIHRSLSGLKDQEVVELSTSWLGLIVPSFVGGILACVLYTLFISGIIRGELFPNIVNDSGAAPEDFGAIFHQHADGPAAYAKLLFWAFVAGFNQQYVVDVIDSIRSRQ
ncbi:hypothetical protein [Crenobacter cavernae]|uniref:Uncharacterized protein n=1 Tax=Crenobacter cavernae TaxID=2290923 RepID=A0A345YAG6_9NEIS|nr:hypothetical protein [Crenobacter cavernae]AXK40918.1 hypothetical protein DWG20_15255 [Crenobacter cavernae]